MLRGFRLGVQGSEAWEVLCTPSKFSAGAAWDLLFRVEPLPFHGKAFGCRGPLAHNVITSELQRGDRKRP